MDEDMLADVIASKIETMKIESPVHFKILNYAIGLIRTFKLNAFVEFIEEYLIFYNKTKNLIDGQGVKIYPKQKISH